MPASKLGAKPVARADTSVCDESGATSAKRNAASTTGSTSAAVQHEPLPSGQAVALERRFSASSRPSRTIAAAWVFTWYPEPSSARNAPFGATRPVLPTKLGAAQARWRRGASQSRGGACPGW